MNSKKSKLIVKSIILAFSVVCFLVVNTSDVENTTKALEDKYYEHNNRSNAKVEQLELFAA